MSNGATETVKLPPLRDLIGHSCPDCETGVVTITSYDPDATHEAGENSKLVGDSASGGAFTWSCPFCGHNGSVAANDLGPWGQPGPFAETQPESSGENANADGPQNGGNGQ